MRYSKDFDSGDSNEENVYAENPIRALDNPVPDRSAGSDGQRLQLGLHARSEYYSH